MTTNPTSPDDKNQYLIQILSSDHIQKFTRTLAKNSNDRMVLGESDRLQSAIESRIQTIIKNNSTISSSEAEIINLLVWDLVDELREGSNSTILADHWISFLFVTAKEFAKYNKNRAYAQDVSYADFEDYCLGSIINPATFINNFFNRFKTYETTETNLLTRLENYANGITRNLVKARLAKELADSTIGKTNIGLSIRYGKKLTKSALERSGIDLIDVERYLDLRQCVKGHIAQQREEERLIPESQLSKEKRIRIDKLKPDDLDKIGKLCKKNAGELSPPIMEILEIIGAAVRYHIQHPVPPEPKSVDPAGIDRQIIIMCAHSCIYWLSEENGNLEPRDKEILYLHYHCQLNQSEIAPIFNVTQGNISRPLSKTNAGISQHFLNVLSEYMEDNPSMINTEININSINAKKSVHVVMEEWFDRFEISQSVNLQSRSNLESLIPEYKHYLEYVEKWRKSNLGLRSDLAGIKKNSQQLEYLTGLNEEDYPGLSRTARSLRMLIEDIGNILRKLWISA
jgi:Sigma-70, region 4